jgi:MerR family transcriptional regulator, light-induced transcriptional regulator
MPSRRRPPEPPPAPGVRPRAAASGDAPSGLTLADLAEAAGIPATTLRAWERRFGRPKGKPQAGGAPTYRAKDVSWLRRVAELLARGARPADVVGLDDDALEARLGAATRAAESDELTTRMLEWVEAFEGARLRRSLREAWNRMEPLAFLRDRLAPLLDAVGRRWADGSLGVRHEHFLAEIVDDLLRTLRERMGDPTGGPIVVLATLPDEQHRLGLQMAALAVLAAGGRVRSLGAGMPVDEIAQAAVEAQARGVGVSVSLSSGGVATDRALAALRERLPADVRLVVGGEGMRGRALSAAGTTCLLDLAEVAAWVQRLDEPA